MNNQAKLHEGASIYSGTRCTLRASCQEKKLLLKVLWGFGTKGSLCYFHVNTLHLTVIPVFLNFHIC